MLKNKNQKIQNPAWLPLLNALHQSWRDGEILKGNDPDPYLEEQLRATGRWPHAPHAADRQSAS
jgi:hypothetical protein